MDTLLVPFLVLLLVVFIPLGLVGYVLMQAALSESRLARLAATLGFERGMRRVQDTWASPQKARSVAYGQLGGRAYTVCYRVYVVRRGGAGITYPAVETWIMTPLASSLSVGVDEPTDILMVHHGMGLGQWGSVWAFSGDFRTMSRNRREAASRLMSLLADPSVKALAADARSAVISASDDEVLLVLRGHASAHRVRRACDAAGRIAEVLPSLRQRLPAGPLERALRWMRGAASSWLQQNPDLGLALSVRTYWATYLVLNIDVQVPLAGLGRFQRLGGEGLTHLARHRPAPLPDAFSTPAVVDALRAAGTQPALSMIDCEGSTLKVYVDPTQPFVYAEIISRAVGLAEALRTARIASRDRVASPSTR